MTHENNIIDLWIEPISPRRRHYIIRLACTQRKQNYTLRHACIEFLTYSDDHPSRMSGLCPSREQSQRGYKRTLAIYFTFHVLCFIFYRQPCVATQPIMFYSCLFIFFFYSPFVLRNYLTDLRKIFRNCVFWCSLNNTIVLKSFWRHLAEKNAKNSINVLKILWVDSDFWLEFQNGQR